MVSERKKISYWNSSINYINIAGVFSTYSTTWSLPYVCLRTIHGRGSSLIHLHLLLGLWKKIFSKGIELLIFEENSKGRKLKMDVHKRWLGKRFPCMRRESDWWLDWEASVPIALPTAAQFLGYFADVAILVIQGNVKSKYDKLLRNQIYFTKSILIIIIFCLLSFWHTSFCVSKFCVSHFEQKDLSFYSLST